jgi:hypothetical protein
MQKICPEPEDSQAKFSQNFVFATRWRSIPRGLIHREAPFDNDGPPAEGGAEGAGQVPARRHHQCAQACQGMTKIL